jgi:transposase
VSSKVVDEPGVTGVSTIESALTTSRKSAPKQQIELITRGERRRSWSMEQKLEVVAESLEPGVSAISVARRHGISTGQLYTWRHQVREEQLGAHGQLPAQFARVGVFTPPTQPGSAMTSVPHEAGSTSARTATARPGGSIEIVLPGGVTVRVDAEVDSSALRRVLTALTIR